MARAIPSSPRPIMDFEFERWDLVIKVKYGESLRRIGTSVNGQLMEHDMAKLRAKIVSLFKFNPDADFLLTYTDEDGDLVTLDNDDELRDAVIGQHLNPLRVNIQLKSNTSASKDAARSESACPAAAAAAANSNKSTTPPPSIHLSVDEALKSVLRSALSDLSGGELKVAPTAPVFSQFVECFSSKLGLAHTSQNSHGTTCESLGGSSGASTRLVDLNVSEEPKGSDVPIQEPSATVSIGPAPKQQESVYVVQNVGIADSGTLDLNQDVPKNKNVSSYPFDELLTSIWTTNERLESEKEGANAHRDGKTVMTPGSSSWLPLPNHLAPTHPNLFYGGFPDMITGDTTKPPTSSQVHPSTQVGVNYHSNGQTSMHGGPQQACVFPIYFESSVAHPYRSHRHHEKTPRTSHRGVQCDGCGMHPIIGSRFKSKLKDDYDLCNLCFSVMGNEADYMRIDRPGHRIPRMPKDFPGFHSRVRFPSSNTFHGSGVRTPRVKLESRFIQDVTVLDGTLMGPSTHFTKIWRMRNNGTAAWPFGTQLVWVGGDQFGDHSSTDLEIPENGFPVEGELDVAVDFTAPSRPGRYVSYWRMASPSGQKFGQRVWVLIQVDYSRPNTPGTVTHPELNLNLPPGSNDRTGVPIIDVNVEPHHSGFTDSDIICTTEELVKSVEEHPSRVVVGDLLDAGNDGYPQPQPTPADVVPFTTLYPLIDIPSPEVPAADGNQVEQTLLKELVDMGFKQIDLNKEILRLNKYDLEQSVDDLCGYAEWDPLLLELQKMGFADKDLNKKMLIKNGGSIKRAVLDMIAGERSQ